MLRTFSTSFIIASLGWLSECYQITPFCWHSSLQTYTRSKGLHQTNPLANSYRKRCRSHERHNDLLISTQLYSYSKPRDPYARLIALQLTKRSDVDDFDEAENSFFDEEDDEDLLSLESTDFVFIGSNPTSIPNLVKDAGTAGSKHDSQRHSNSLGKNEISMWDDSASDLRTQNVPPRSIVEAASLRHKQKALRMQLSANNLEDHSKSDQVLHHN